MMNFNFTGTISKILIITMSTKFLKNFDWEIKKNVAAEWKLHLLIKTKLLWITSKKFHMRKTFIVGNHLPTPKIPLNFNILKFMKYFAESTRKEIERLYIHKESLLKIRGNCNDFFLKKMKHIGIRYLTKNWSKLKKRLFKKNRYFCNKICIRMPDCTQSVGI